MSERLRFTGEWPPFRYWAKYPNWDFALDEEDVEGQDETTLRPASVQDHIAPDAVAFTVGEAILADGRRLPALINVFSGEPHEVHVFVADGKAWCVRFGAPRPEWSAYVEDWLPEAERGPSVALSDSSVFPLTVCTRLPRSLGGTPYSFVIKPDGSWGATS